VEKQQLGSLGDGRLVRMGKPGEQARLVGVEGRARRQPRGQQGQSRLRQHLGEKRLVPQGGYCGEPLPDLFGITAQAHGQCRFRGGIEPGSGALGETIGGTADQPFQPVGQRRARAIVELVLRRRKQGPDRQRRPRLRPHAARRRMGEQHCSIAIRLGRTGGHAPSPSVGSLRRA
jgi:hypothetical protein